jgi:hypothetical protein
MIAQLVYDNSSVGHLAATSCIGGAAIVSEKENAIVTNHDRILKTMLIEFFLGFLFSDKNTIDRLINVSIRVIKNDLPFEYCF